MNGCHLLFGYGGFTLLAKNFGHKKCPKIKPSKNFKRLKCFQLQNPFMERALIEKLFENTKWLDRIWVIFSSMYLHYSKTIIFTDIASV